ncbi:MAG: RagB/SusD family nutrient uptake outer membrane protein [Bacteroidota bacterium]
MKKLSKIIVVLLLSVSTITCVDLEIENTNDPDIDFVLSSPEELKNYTAGLFNTWYNSEQHNFGSPGPAMWVMADWGSVTWANYGCVDMSKEPRIFLNNSISYAYHTAYRNFYRRMYRVVTSSNDVLKAIEGGIEIGENGNETEMVKGMCYFMQGLGNGYIGLVYDQGFPSDETIEDYFSLEIQPYSVSIEMAIQELEKAIEIFDANSFTLPINWMSREFSSAEMSKIAHSFIARLLVYSSRNKDQNEAVDWQKVLSHAEAGITEDFTIQGDGNISSRKWMSWYKYYLARPSWGKVDMRVINMIDNNLPANWPENGIDDMPNDGQMNVSDARATTDFEYDPSNNRPERGKYRWSTYRYSRLDDYINANFFAPVVMMRKTEIDLFKAEAHAQLEQYGLAADIINAGTRVTRGNLTPISSNPEDVKNAIIYERTIELPLTGMGIQFFDMRRHGELQDGSLLHFPIPAQQLEILQMPTYTFGGISPQYGVQNEDVAIDGWYNASED